MKKEWKERNVRFLKEVLKEKGFPEAAVREMAERVQVAKEPVIILHFATTIDGDGVQGRLVFRNTQTISGYQLDHFSLDLASRTGAKLQAYVFKPGSGKDVGLQEAHNLMYGRYVYKAGAWLAIGFQSGHSYVSSLDNDKLPFRVEKALKVSTLSRYLKPDQQKALIESLKQGNRQELAVQNMGILTTIWVVVNPLAGKIQLSNREGEPVHLDRPTSKFAFAELVAG